MIKKALLKLTKKNYLKTIDRVLLKSMNDRIITSYQYHELRIRLNKAREEKDD